MNDGTQRNGIQRAMDTIQNLRSSLCTAADSVNTWCRTLGIEECERPLVGDELRDAIERIYSKVTEGPPTVKDLLAKNVTQDIGAYTCYDCSQWRNCEFAFDGYNLDGDCLADK